MRRNRPLTHEQARRALQAVADNQLEPGVQAALDQHLESCPQCQGYADQLAALDARLAQELPAAWQVRSSITQQAASTLEKIHAQSRHNQMKNILSSTTRILALGIGIVALISGLTWGIRAVLPANVSTQAAQQLTNTPASTEQGNGQHGAPTAISTTSLEATDDVTQTEPVQAAVSASAPGLFPTTGFDFPQGFPESPASVNLYQMQLPEAITPERALQMAARLGVAGGVYSMPSEGFDQTIYEVTDGFELLRFINFAEQFVFETGYTDPMYSDRVPLSYNEQLQIATDYLNSFGLLDQPYQAEPSAIEQGVVRFTPLLDGHRVIYGNGQNPGNMEWISVQVNPSGQVSLVMYSQQHFTTLGEYPILSAAQAWDRLSADNANQRSYFAVMPAEQTNTYHVWSRTYPLGQTVDLHGYIYARHPVDPADPVLVYFNNYLVPNGAELAALDPGANIHAWGQFIQDEDGNRLFEVESWEISPIVEEYYEGTIQRMDTLGLLVTADSTRTLPDLPQDVPDGMQVFVTGIPQAGNPSVLDWIQISGGNYPNSYYTSRSCGGFGGGGGGGSENVNFGSGSFALPRLEPVFSPTATPEPGPYPIGEYLDGITGRIYAVNHLYANGSSLLEYNIITDPIDEAPIGGFYRLEGPATTGLEQLQGLPVRIWGRMTGNIDYTPIITLDQWEPQYPGLSIQQWNGTEEIVTLEGQDVILLTAESGEAFVLQSSLTWGAEGNLIGNLGDTIEIEGYVIPERQLGGYPVIQDLSAGMPPDDEVTSDDVIIYDHTFDAPDVNSLLAGQVTIDHIELAYASITMHNCLSSHATDPNILPSLTVQPVWVFTGHFADGRIIVIQVQALPEEYLQ